MSKTNKSTFFREEVNEGDLNLADVAQALLSFKSIPYSFEYFPFWKDIFNSERLTVKVDQVDRKLVYKCSRQVGKSVSTGAIAASMAYLRDNFTVIVCQPTDKQISQFSADILKRFVSDTIPLDEWYYETRKTERQVKKMSFTTGSRIVLANIHSSVLSVRGISSACAIFDEMQDLPEENVTIVLNTMNRSPYRFSIFSGTPKTPDNPLEQKWQDSTQNEWMVKCTHCNYWNGPLGGDGTDKRIHNIGNHGIVCMKCGRRIFAQHGEWVAAHPTRNIGGYHINELMVPPTAPGSTSWQELLYRMTHDPLVTVFNEILGVSYADSTHPVTEQTVRDNCHPDRLYARTVRELIAARNFTNPAFAGLDWAMETAPRSGNTVSIKSYTMLTIAELNLNTNRLEILFRRKYYDMTNMNADDPEAVLKDITEYCDAAKIELLGCDYGAGHKENQRLREMLGWSRVMEFQYVGDVGDYYTYDGATSKWITPRTNAMTECIDAIKQGEFEFAKFSGETTEHLTDLTTIYRFNDPVKRTLRYGKTKPDDWFQNLTYLLLAKLWYRGEFNRFRWIEK